MKKIIIIVGVLIFIIALRLFIKKSQNSKLSEICLTDKFVEEFSSLNNVRVMFDFNKLFNCDDWDKVFVVEAPYINRALIYLGSDVLLPDYDYNNINEGTYILFFLNGNTPMGKPIKFTRDNFIFSNNFNRLNFLKINKEEAKFVYKKYEHTDYNLWTLELIK